MPAMAAVLYDDLRIFMFFLMVLLLWLLCSMCIWHVIPKGNLTSLLTCKTNVQHITQQTKQQPFALCSQNKPQWRHTRRDQSAAKCTQRVQSGSAHSHWISLLGYRCHGRYNGITCSTADTRHIVQQQLHNSLFNISTAYHCPTFSLSWTLSSHTCNAFILMLMEC